MTAVDEGRTCAGCGQSVDADPVLVLLTRPPRRELLCVHPRIGCILEGLAGVLEGGLLHVLTRGSL